MPVPRVQEAPYNQYRASFQSGLMTTATVAAGGTVFSARWADTTKFAVVTDLVAYYVVTTAFTAIQELGLDLWQATAWTVADSSGTSQSLVMNKLKSTMGTSLWTAIRLPTTTVVTAGTRTLYGNPLLSARGISHDTNAAAGTAQIPAPRCMLAFKADLQRGDMPIVIGASEGIVITNTTVFPAAGVARLCVDMTWQEMPVY